MKKRFAGVLLAVTMVVSLLAACGGSSSGSASSESGSGEEAQGSQAASESQAAPESQAAEATASGEEITLDFWTISLQPTFTDFFNGLIAQYESDHPGVKIKWSDMPIADIDTQLVTASTGGTSPDVVNLNTSYALRLGGMGALVDLNAEATEEQKSIYVKDLWESARLGDAVYAFPWYASPDIGIYNSELFEQAGMTPPETYDEALDMAEEFYEKTGAYLFNPNSVFYMLSLNGIPILNEDKTAAAFNTEEVKNLLDRYKALTDIGALPKDGWGNWDSELQMFESSQLAIVSSAATTVDRVRDEAPDVYEKISLGKPLAGTLGVTRNALMNIVVPEASKNHQAAIDFAAFITNDESQLAFCKEVSIFPSTTAASQDPFFTEQDGTKEKEAIAMGVEAGMTSRDFSLGIAANDNVANTLATLGEAVIANGEDTQAALDQAEQDVNDILSQQ